jgi:hypothetical protein
VLWELESIRLIVDTNKRQWVISDLEIIRFIEDTDKRKWVISVRE